MSSTSRIPTDPVERIVYEMLINAGVEFVLGEGSGELDFFLPGLNLHIECKQFHSERAIRQLSDKPNAILIQGIGAAEAFRTLIRRNP